MDHLAEDKLITPPKLGVAIEPPLERTLRKDLALIIVDRFESVGEFLAGLLTGNASSFSREVYV
jgi:hypothetical protein